MAVLARPGPAKPVFGRDLLQAEIAAPDGKPLHVFVNHFTSNFIANEHRMTPDQVAAERENIVQRRTDQACAIKEILARQRHTRRAVVTGDFNDAPNAATLAALTGANLIERISNATTIAGPNRSGALINDKFADQSPTMWTHRHRTHGVTTCALYDYIWTTTDLPITAAHVMRRTQITGDGSDHDPAYIDLALS